MTDEQLFDILEKQRNLQTIHSYDYDKVFIYFPYSIMLNYGHIFATSVTNGQIYIQKKYIPYFDVLLIIKDLQNLRGASYAIKRLASPDNNSNMLSEA